MATLTFDTHKFIRKLESAGFSTEQAEAVAEAFQDASGEAAIATKQDIRELEVKIREAELKLEAKIADSKAELIRWVVAVGILQITLIAALLLKLAPP